MGHEFRESEMYPCDRCGEVYPIDEMYQLRDGHIICEDCYSEGWEDNNED